MIKVFKIGGNVVDDPDKLNEFLTKFAKISGDKILVHGGGKIATTISKALGIETVMVEGRRVTDVETIKVVTMVYAGLINKSVVAALNAKGVKSLGLCGADVNTIISKKRDNTKIDYGFVGDPILESVNTDFLCKIIIDGIVPVLAPITVDNEGTLLNTNADTIAQTLAVALSKIAKTSLIYCFEKNGVLESIDDPNSVIKNIAFSEYQTLKLSGVISDGMIPKIDNAFSAISSGVESVYICNSDNIDKQEYQGTKIYYA